MWRLIIALMLALAATAASAQDPKPDQSQAPAGAGGNTLRPFLFDARMPGDGSRHRPAADKHHTTGGAIVPPPKANEPEPQR